MDVIPINSFLYKYYMVCYERGLISWYGKWDSVFVQQKYSELDQAFKQSEERLTQKDKVMREV